MSLREISFPSANGRDTVRAWAYTPLGTPRGVIQLMHGYGEHSRRYLHMISAFNRRASPCMRTIISAMAKRAWITVRWAIRTRAGL